MSATGALPIWLTAKFPRGRRVSDIEYMAAIEEGVKISGSQIRTNFGVQTSGGTTNVDIVVTSGKDGYVAKVHYNAFQSNNQQLSSWSATLIVNGVTIDSMSGTLSFAGNMSGNLSHQGKKALAGETIRLTLTGAVSSGAVAGSLTIIEVPTGVSPVLP